MGSNSAEYYICRNTSPKGFLPIFYTVFGLKEVIVTLDIPFFVLFSLYFYYFLLYQNWCFIKTLLIGPVGTG